MLLFALVGIIVSMDVAGLTISKTEQFAVGSQSLDWWSLSNACWHSGLLAVYLLVINGVLRISPEYLAYIEALAAKLWQIADFLPQTLLATLRITNDAIRQHLTLMLGVLALVIVWKTYSAKIISEPSEGEVADLPPLARAAFNVLEFFVRAIGFRRVGEARLTQFLHNQAQAALVAVDMLALAILLKSTGAIRGFNEGVIVVLVVFVIVLLMTRLTAKYALQKFNSLRSEGGALRLSRVRALHWLRITLRLGEPFLIFYFVLQLVALLLLEEQVHGVSLFFGAGLLVWALVDKYSLAEIVRRTLSNARPSSVEQPVRPMSSVLADMGRLLGMVFLVILLIPIGFLLFAAAVWLITPGPPDQISFDQKVSTLIGWFTILTAGVFFPKFRRLESLENKLIQGLEFLVHNRRTFVFLTCAMFIATVFPIYDQLIDEASRSGNRPSLSSIRELLQPAHRHVLQVGVWFALFISIGAILEIAETKYRVPLGDLAKKPEVEKIYGRWLYGIVLTLIGGLMLAVGYLQGIITT
jgi:hypothetical protein